MTAGQLALVAAAGFLAGAVNAIAGGGSLISFPALMAVGCPSVTANVTNAVAVLPGYLGGSVAYRAELAGQGARLRALAAASALGAVGGSLLLLGSPASVFQRLVPFLVLGSCALLAAQPRLARRFAAASAGGDGLPVGGALAAQFGVAVYGGYFGAGVGLLMLAVLGIFLHDGLHRLNALKGLLSFVVGAVSCVFFALFGPVVWPAALAMAVTSFAGGQAGVRLARRLPAALLRWIVIAFGVSVSIALLR